MIKCDPGSGSDGDHPRVEVGDVAKLSQGECPPGADPGHGQSRHTGMRLPEPLPLPGNGFEAK